jgi:hypothetical protein
LRDGDLLGPWPKFGPNADVAATSHVLHCLVLEGAGAAMLQEGLQKAPSFRAVAANVAVAAAVVNAVAAGGLRRMSCHAAVKSGVLSPADQKAFNSNKAAAQAAEAAGTAKGRWGKANRRTALGLQLAGGGKAVRLRALRAGRVSGRCARSNGPLKALLTAL